MAWIVSARSVLEPRFLASVSFKCSRNVLGVVVLWKGYFLSSFSSFSFFSSSILSRKSVGTSRLLRAMSWRKALFFESSLLDFFSLSFTSPAFFAPLLAVFFVSVAAFFASVTLFCSKLDFLGSFLGSSLLGFLT